MGMGITTIQSEYKGIQVRTRYFIPPGVDLEIWELYLASQRSAEVSLSIFASVEFCLWDAWMMPPISA